MKKVLPFFIAFSSLIRTQAQVVFCPPGAEWRYSFYNNMTGAITNEKIRYVGDAIIGSETVKYIEHTHFFSEVNPVTSIGSTYFKQTGDTVFVRNNITKNKWQILYNFNVQAGQSWQNDFTTGIFDIFVDSVKQIIIDGFNLKRLYVRYPGVIPGSTKKEIITERFGCHRFLFNFLELSASDGDYVQEFLCYKDNIFGQKQVTSKPCDFSNLSGIESLENIESYIAVFPNPTSNLLNLQVKKQGNFENINVALVNIIGEKVQDIQLRNHESQLDLRDLKAGVYFLQVFDERKLIATEKIVKEN